MTGLIPLIMKFDKTKIIDINKLKIMKFDGLIFNAAYGLVFETQLPIHYALTGRVVIRTALYSHWPQFYCI